MRISDWSSDVCSSDLIDGALSGADGLISEFQRMKWQEDRGVKNENGYDNQRYVLREAAGVVGAITPWNVPLYINVGKVVAALLAGCTVVLKPAPATPAMGAIFGELGRASCRERVCQYVSFSVVADSLQKKI